MRATSCEHKQCYRYCVVYNNFIRSFASWPFYLYPCFHVFLSWLLLLCLSASSVSLLFLSSSHSCYFFFRHFQKQSADSPWFVLEIRYTLSVWCTCAHTHSNSIYYRYAVYLVSLSQSYRMVKKSELDDDASALNLPVSYLSMAFIPLLVILKCEMW